MRKIFKSTLPRHHLANGILLSRTAELFVSNPYSPLDGLTGFMKKYTLMFIINLITRQVTDEPFLNSEIETNYEHLIFV